MKEFYRNSLRIGKPSVLPTWDEQMLQNKLASWLKKNNEKIQLKKWLRNDKPYFNERFEEYLV